MEFLCGRNVDANIKSYKETAAYNQLTRTSLSRFCNHFNIDYFDLLQDSFIRKTKSINSKLIPKYKQNEILDMLQLQQKIWSNGLMRYKKSRETLVLYERNNSLMQIYAMKDVFKKIDYKIEFTNNSNIAIGNSIII